MKAADDITAVVAITVTGTQEYSQPVSSYVQNTLIGISYVLQILKRFFPLLEEFFSSLKEARRKGDTETVVTTVDTVTQTPAWRNDIIDVTRQAIRCKITWLTFAKFRARCFSSFPHEQNSVHDHLAYIFMPYAGPNDPHNKRNIGFKPRYII